MEYLASYQIVETLEAAGLKVVAARDLALPTAPATEISAGMQLWADVVDDSWLTKVVAGWLRASSGCAILLAADAGRAAAAAADLSGAGTVALLGRGSTQVKRDARIVVVDPGALHDPLLCHHDRWSRVWRNLGLVGVLGAESLTGGVGSHAGLLLRRTLRLAGRLAPPSSTEWEEDGEHGPESAPGPAVVLAGNGISNGLAHGRSLLGSGRVAVASGQEPSQVSRPWVVVDDSAGDAHGRVLEALGERPGLPIELVSSGVPPRRRGIFLLRSPRLAAWLRQHPEPCFTHAAIDPASEAIQLNHLLAASAEAVFLRSDDRWFGPGAWKKLAPFHRRLVREEHSESGKHGDAWRYQGWEPADLLVQPDLIEREPFRVTTHGRRSSRIGELSHGAVALLAHPGAILHLADKAYRVRKVDLDEREIRVSPENARAIAAGRKTLPRHRRHHEILRALRTAPPFGDGSLAALGEIEIVESVTSYDLIKTGGRQPEPAAIEPAFVTSYASSAAWVDFAPGVLQSVLASGADRRVALGLVAEALRVRLIWRIGAERCGEILVAPYASHASFDGGGFFVHEAVPHGTGVAHAAWDLLPELLKSALGDLQRCAMPPLAAARLSAAPEPGSDSDRRGAIALIEHLLQ